ncbi:MAG: hypothetical protein DWI02_12610 [Planctomycetota bacterium]|nr:MAG: hypothetical protein DWI02_12610 [Planctomycetota bacterium]
MFLAGPETSSLRTRFPSADRVPAGKGDRGWSLSFLAMILHSSPIVISTDLVAENGEVLR